MYTKQSLQQFDREVLYHEGFQSSFDLIKNGAVIIGAPTFLNGIATLNGSTDAFNINNTLERVRDNTVGTFIIKCAPVDATPAANETLLSFSDTNANEGIEAYIQTDGTLRVVLIDGGTTQWDFASNAAVFSDNTTVEIAIVQNGTVPVMYANGAVITSTFSVTTNQTRWFSVLAANIDNARIGDRSINGGGEEQHFNGTFDFVKLINRNYSVTEIASHFANILYTPPPTANEVLNIDPRQGVIADSHGNAVINNSVSVVNDGGFKAGEYDGTTSFLNIDAVLPASLATTTVGTWIIWVKPVVGMPSLEEEIMGFHDTSAIEFVFLAQQSNGRPRVLLRKTGFPNQWNLSFDTATLSSNTWAHLAIVQDGITPVLYLNGVAENQSFTVDVDRTMWFNDLAGLDNGRIGNRNFNGSGEIIHFDGRIGPAKIYNTNFSATLIERDYLITKHFFNR